MSMRFGDGANMCANSIKKTLRDKPAAPLSSHLEIVKETLKYLQFDTRCIGSEIAHGGSKAIFVIRADQRIEFFLDLGMKLFPVAGMLEIAHDVGPAIDFVDRMQTG